MSNMNLSRLSVDQLVDLFVAITVDQGEAIRIDDSKKFNRLFGRMIGVVNELKGRDGDQRKALIRLYNYPNMQVRLKAATSTLAVAPEAARQVLQSIVDAQYFPQAGDAGMTLSNLDSDFFKPT